MNNSIETIRAALATTAKWTAPEVEKLRIENASIQIARVRAEQNRLFTSGKNERFTEQAKNIASAIRDMKPIPPSQSVDDIEKNIRSQIDAMSDGIRLIQKESNSDLRTICASYADAVRPIIEGVRDSEIATAQKCGVDFEPSKTLVAVESVLAEAVRLSTTANSTEQLKGIL